MSHNKSVNTKDYSITELIDTDPRYEGLKERLSAFRTGSDEYIREMFNELPLTSWPRYKTFLKEQAVPMLDSNENHSYSPVYRSSLSPNHLITTMDPHLKTFYDHFQFAVRNWPTNDCLGVRTFDPVKNEYSNQYYWESYQTVNDRSQAFGSGLLSLVNTKRGKPLRSNDFIVSILSHNTPEWIIADFACQAYSLTNTALYETLGPQTSEYIMNLTESPVLIFAKSNIYNILRILPKFKHLNTLICTEDLTKEELSLFNTSLLSISENSKNEKISMFSLKQVETIGKLNQIPLIPPNPDSVYTISFTSGTTGLPKGVEMTQRNITSGIAFSMSTFYKVVAKRGQQLHDICFLPLAHIFERMLIAWDLSQGVGLGFLHQPDPTVLVEDLKILKPDAIALVPRILTRFEAGIKNSLDKSTFQKNVANNILDSKVSRFTSRGGPDKSLMNFLVFHRVLIDKIRTSLGLNNASYIVTGSAPISKDTLLFLRSALDIGVRQGYGLTESFAGICLSEPHERDVGSCGAIGISAECRLRSVPEMGYDAAKDLKGELLLRGPQIFSKYFKNPEETSKAIDSNGWFATGDIGFIDGKGRLHIIDRVKNFFKLAHGEYIAPEKIENLYLSSCPYITQIFVYGNPLKNHLVGVLGLDIPGVQAALEKKNRIVKSWTDEQLIDNLNLDPQLRLQLLKLVNKYTKGLQGFEKLHNIYVGLEPLTVEDDVITPTLKIKRMNASKRFKKELDALYEEGSLIKNGNL
ncbi:medium-chain fatty acid-CoA ligase FAA2 NDAI_0E03600 [Naumovozyma dairenensis CBS 421]|uniref:AMP-dependent synthetase/ligase domain-containing protein n=1 Tax=Naumovozyma dairenensis (strain ATCC 10597 / BCRC 20456 / CBS 421 / NBRC 0211 / NRRL Y-12639) TaxID=1071378 RepID=G0WBQ7_NAUDC|nr:hypothetical protein NDAI_0E03600 [Naumovozyma dairenensis CBS 421]CCD25177.1 hypothetical protein NDAI_0E03600 [Naumovozyma dairenensis CBS 421]